MYKTVIVSDHDESNGAKTLYWHHQLNKADRTSTVVKVLLEKLDLSDSQSNYTLLQVTPQGTY